MKQLLPVFAIFLAFPAVAEEASIVFEGGGERLKIEGTALEDVALYAVEGGHSVVFRLNEEDGAAFSALTGRLIGQVLTLSICGEVLAKPVVRDQISGTGIVPVSDLETALAYVFALKGEAPCP